MGKWREIGKSYIENLLKTQPTHGYTNGRANIEIFWEKVRYKIQECKHEDRQQIEAQVDEHFQKSLLNDINVNDFENLLKDLEIFQAFQHFMETRQKS